jgi:hypothetical protein
LDQLLGPIALYPDPLLAEILPAATLPTQIVMADRYVSDGGDPSQIVQQPWDASVQAMAHYPDVLKYLDDNLAWTMQLGQAFLNQEPQVMASIQRLRISAQDAGNLQSTPEQQVVEDDGDIEILPAQPDVIYVPIYQSVTVFYQSGFAPGFGVGCRMGPWLHSDFDWTHHNLRSWGVQHPRPPYWWREQPAQRAAMMVQQTTVWHSQNNQIVGVAGRESHNWNNVAVNQSQITAARIQLILAQQRQEQFRQQVQQYNSAAVINMQRLSPAFHPEANNALINGGSPNTARVFGDRGQQQNMQTFTRPAPLPAAPTVLVPAQPAPQVWDPSPSTPQNPYPGQPAQQASYPVQSAPAAPYQVQPIPVVSYPAPSPLGGAQARH